MVKKKRGRQCLPMARRQCKQERKHRIEDTQKSKEAQEKGEYENVSSTLLR